MSDSITVGVCICNVLSLDKDEMNVDACLPEYTCVCVYVCVSASCRLKEETAGCFVLLPGLHQYWTLEFKRRVVKSHHTMPREK